MRVGILGSGQVGRTLGSGFIARGDDVVMGTRDPKGEVAAAWLRRSGSRACVDTYERAAGWCELACFVPAWMAAPHVVELCGPDNLAGKVVIDVTNPLAPDSQHGPGLSVGCTDSAGEQVQRMLPQAHVVKAFNIVGYRQMVHPQLPGGPPTMLICGNDNGAKAAVTRILDDFGWETADLGDITASRAIEPVTLAWLLYGTHYGVWDHAFKMLTT